MILLAVGCIVFGALPIGYLVFWFGIYSATGGKESIWDYAKKM